MRSRIARGAAALAAAIVGPLVAAHAEPRPEVGDVERVRGEAAAVFAETRRPLGLADPVFFQDLLETGEDARLVARLRDDTAITLGANASLVLDEFVYDPAANERLVTLRSLAGAFVVAIRELKEFVQSRVAVDTPVGVLSLASGVAWGGEIDDGYGILALDGTVSLATAAGTATLEKGEGMTVTDAAELAPVVTWDPDKVARAVATVTIDEPPQGRLDSRPPPDRLGGG